MGLTLLSGNTSPVSEDDMKDHLRLTGLDVQDALLQAAIDGATQYFQDATRQQLVTASYAWKFDAFPGAGIPPSWAAGRCGRIVHADDLALIVPLPPLVSVASIQYLDTTGASQTLSSAAYTVDTASKPGRIVLNQGYAWPATIQQANAVTVTFTAGYGSASSVPPLLRQGIKLLAAHWYENREAASDRKFEALPMALQSIIDQQNYGGAV